MIKTYYNLTKPGIIYGNLLTATAGFLLASNGHINGWLFTALLAGTSFVIASACVFNNYIDRDIDTRMARTKQRALAEGTISGRSALIYAAILGLVGVAVLILFTNRLTLVIGALAFIDYVVFYGIAKRRSVHGTIVGSFSGAAPILAGYVAVAGRIDTAAVILFLILLLWQMPHFYAIAMYRADDYRAASIPVLPIKHGLRATKLQMMFYVAAFIVAAVSLSLYGYTGYAYRVVILILGIMWLRLGAKGLGMNGEGEATRHWARRMFHFSLIVILVLSVMLALNPLLP